MASVDPLVSDTNAELVDLEQDASQNGRKIFIGGLSWSTTEDGLQDYFKRMGAPVDRLSIMRDKATGCSRGFGFVTFCTVDGLELVCSRRHVLDGRKIECKRAIPKNEIATQMRRVFVGGIPLTLQETELRAYFEKFGAVEECRIMTDRVSNRSRGFAFVCFYDDDVMNAVLNAKHQLDGKPFEVKKARVKQQMTFEAEAKAAAAQLETQSPNSATSLIPSQVQLSTAGQGAQSSNPTASPQNGMPMFFPYSCFPAKMGNNFPGFYIYPTDPSALENGSFFFPPGFIPQDAAEMQSLFGAPGQAEANYPADQSTEIDMSSLEDALGESTTNHRTSNRKTWTANPSKRTVGKINRSLTASEAEPQQQPPPSPTAANGSHKRTILISASPPSSRTHVPPVALPSSNPHTPGRETSPKSPLHQLHWSPEIPSKPISPKLNEVRRAALVDHGNSDAFSAVKPYLYTPQVPVQDQQTYLERGLSLLRPQETRAQVLNNRRSDSPIKREKLALVEKSRKRGVSIPHSLEKNRPLDQNWRPGLPKNTDTIEKYFPPIMVKNQADFS